MTRRRQELGKYGEGLALKQYLQGGYTLLVQNYHCRFGEIDLIMLKERSLVFVEVRTKTTTAFGSPEESITPRKQHKIRLVSQFFLRQYAQYSQFDLQFDVVSIYIQKEEKRAWINRIEHAF